MTAIFAKCSRFREAFERSEVRRECSRAVTEFIGRAYRRVLRMRLVESAERRGNLQPLNAVN